MAGASDDHNRIAGNLFNELSNRLRVGRCEAFINDMKVKIPPQFGDAFYYPDVLVTCDPSDAAKYFRERSSFILKFSRRTPNAQIGARKPSLIDRFPASKPTFSWSRTTSWRQFSARRKSVGTARGLKANAAC